MATHRGLLRRGVPLLLPLLARAAGAPSPACALNGPCPVPPWRSSWDIAGSMAIQLTNYTGYFDPAIAARYGACRGRLAWAALAPRRFNRPACVPRLQQAAPRL
jgi:hypothetical protein